jgi:aminopeptidase N
LKAHDHENDLQYGDCEESKAKNSRRPRFALPGAWSHYPPDRKYDSQHLKLEISLDLEKKSVQGKATLTLTALVDGLQRIDVDAVEMSIKSVRASSGRDLNYDYTGEKLSVHLDRPLPADQEAVVSIEYSATPRRGLHFVGPDDAYPNKPLQAWSHGEEENNRHWFPCYDFPNDRMTSEVTVTVPERFLAISNGRLLSVSEDKKNGTRTYHWFQEVPHVSYLVSVAVGEFEELQDEWQGIPLTYYVPMARGKDATRSFQNTPKMLQFFSDTTGLRYPYAKYSQVTVADFVIGGQENITATTLTEETLHDERAHLEYTSDNLVSHELVHQWFGDLITCKDWAHLWLNEGFATYFEALYKEHDLGRDEFHARLLEYYEQLQQFLPGYLDEVREKYRRPIVTRTYHDPGELFDHHSYEKAGLVLHMLRYILGDKQFWKVIRRYVEKYREKTVETSDFKSTVEEVTGRSMDLFFEQWFFKPGHPELSVKVEWREDSKTLTITVQQIQDTSDGTPIFQFPAEILVVDELEEKTHRIDIVDKSHTFQFSLQRKPLSVVFDPENWILKTVAFDKPLQMLLYELKNGKSITTRIWAARTLAKPRTIEVVKALGESILHDPFWLVQAESAGALGAIGSDAALEALLEGLKVKHPKARRGVARALGAFRNERAADALLDVLQKDESYFVEAEAARSLGKTKSSKAFEILINAFRTKGSYRDIIRVYALKGLADLKDTRAAPIILEGTQYGLYFRVRQAATELLGKIGSLDPMAFDRLTELLRDRNYHVRIAAAEALEELGDLRAIPELERVIEKDAEPNVRIAARRAIYVISEAGGKNGEWRKLHDEVDELKKENSRLRQQIEAFKN